ncbi:hypothetical protein [Succinimonas sp.]
MSHSVLRNPDECRLKLIKGGKLLKPEETGDLGNLKLAEDRLFRLSASCS